MGRLLQSRKTGRTASNASGSDRRVFCLGASSAGASSAGASSSSEPRRRASCKPWARRGDNDLKIVVRGAASVSAGASSSRREAMKSFSSAMAFLDSSIFWHHGRYSAVSELFTDGVVAVIQLAQLDLGLFDLVFLGIDGNVGLCDGSQLLRLCGGSLGGLYGNVLCSFKIFRKNAWRSSFQQHICFVISCSIPPARKKWNRQVMRNVSYFVNFLLIVLFFIRLRFFAFAVDVERFARGLLFDEHPREDSRRSKEGNCRHKLADAMPVENRYRLSVRNPSIQTRPRRTTPHRQGTPRRRISAFEKKCRPMKPIRFQTDS